MPARLPQHTERPGTDELVVRYRLAGREFRGLDQDVVVPCQTTDPEVFFPDDSSGLNVTPFKAERQALDLCTGCTLAPACLVREMRETPTVFQIRGVRAGLRQSERRALYLALQKDGLL
jgi:hypothetical protein